MAQASLNLDPTVKNVETFEFEPIKGYPMLQWKGKRPFRSTHYYPAQHKETHGEEVNGWLNQIFWGDNLQVMSHLLKKFRGQVKLVYIDPPFDSKADYKLIIKLRGQEVKNTSSVFEEKQYSDIWTNDEYLQFMYERLVLLRELLTTDGAILVHCDWHKTHHLRCLMDEVFGAANFRNEIIWAYPGREMHIDNKYNAKHDTILFYAKSPEARVNMSAVALAYDREQRIIGLRRKVYTDEDGREWVWETRGQSAGQEPYKRFIDDIIKDGKALNDVWSDIQFLRGNDPQRTGYPTQKPEELLERIIKAHSKPGDIVFDCFMGSGTTQSTAVKLGRRFLGADINLGAVQKTTKRLIEIQQEAQKNNLLIDTEEVTLYTGFSVYNVNNYDIFRNPAQAKDLLIEALELQPLPSGNVFDAEQDGFMVKIMPVNRIATKADLRELVMNIDQREWMRRRDELGPNKPVEHIRLVCMGHDPDLGAELERELSDFKLKVEVVDILRDRGDLEFKRDAQADIKVKGDKLVIRRFYPMNLLQKLSLQKEKVGDWRELVESVMVDFNYDGAVLQPQVVDIPEGLALVKGEYTIPANAGTIRVKITDLLSESLEMTLPDNG